MKIKFNFFWKKCQFFDIFWRIFKFHPKLIFFRKNSFFLQFSFSRLETSFASKFIIFFQWNLWYCIFQIWNPGGLQEAFRSCILVWSFDFLSKSVEKPKIFSKQDRGIMFFPVKAEMFLFPNLKPRRPPEALFWFENFVFFWKFWKISKFHIKIELREASWMPPGYQIWKTQHLSFHWKKIIPLSFFERNLSS